MPVGAEAKTNRGTVLLRGYVYATTTILVVVAVVLLLAACKDWALLGRQDAVFGLTIRIVLVLAGLVQLAACAWLLAARDLISQGVILLWVGLSHTVYRLALAWLGVPKPLTILRVIGMEVTIRAGVLEPAWKLFMAYLVIGSLVVLLVEWRRLRRENAELFLEHWRKLRDDGEG